MTEETRPLAGLPGADRTLLAHPPLELAVAEFRLTSGDGELSPDFGLRFKERLAELGLVLARMEPIQQQRLSLNVQAGVAATPQVETGTHGWLLVSADGATQVSLLPEAVVYQTSKYHRWSVTMRPPIEAILVAVSELRKPALVVRIGVRYVNRFVDPAASSAQAWVEHLDEHFLGPLCHPDLGGHVKASQQQVELAFSDTQGARLRHGPFLDATAGGSVSYLVDIDVFDADPLRFDPAHLVERAEVLNRTAATLFQAVLKPEYLRALQGPAGTEESKPQGTEESTVVASA
jgi:uncharacterized protein (TIGR04255 family)